MQRLFGKHDADRAAHPLTFSMNAIALQCSSNRHFRAHTIGRLSMNWSDRDGQPVLFPGKPHLITRGSDQSNAVGRVTSLDPARATAELTRPVVLKQQDALIVTTDRTMASEQTAVGALHGLTLCRNDGGGARPWHVHGFFDLGTHGAVLPREATGELDRLLVDRTRQ